MEPFTEEINRFNHIIQRSYGLYDDFVRGQGFADAHFAQFNHDFLH